LQNCCTIQKSENNQSSLFFFLSFTDSLGPLSATQRNHGGAALTGRPQNAPSVMFWRN